MTREKLLSTIHQPAAKGIAAVMAWTGNEGITALHMISEAAKEVGDILTAGIAIVTALSLLRAGIRKLMRKKRT